MEFAELQELLAAAAVGVLETMCFTSVEAEGEGLSPAGREPGPAMFCAETRFHGSPSGGFRVGLPVPMARAVSAGFLGLDEEEVSDAQAADVVCELANMICGSVLSRLESDTGFRIEHPELADPSRPGMENASAARWFDLGDGVMAVSLRLDAAGL
jgi:hypothetical protein